VQIRLSLNEKILALTRLALLLFGDFSMMKYARLAPDGAASPKTPSPHRLMGFFV